MIKYNKEIFIEKAKKLHGDKYDYSLVNYINGNINIKIICKEHGIFTQIPKSHLKGHGCSMCNGGIKLTKDSFIKKSEKVHGNKYDYSLVEYKNAHTKVKIICKKHGIFTQIPNSHLMNHGCPKCYGNDKKTTDVFIKESKEIHGDKYEYSLVEYINTNTKVKIICKEHGIFKQKPIKHLRKQGCPKCGIIIRTDNITKTIDNFIKESKEIHDNKYDYSLVEYNGSFTKVKIICKEHGIFEQKPIVHINNKSGCPKCANILTGKLLTDGEDVVIGKFKTVHGNKYDYSLVEYNGSFTKVKIICKEHGIFEQNPSSHIQNVGCPKCYYSKGEEKIRKYLENEKLIYKEQYKFNDCRNILPLPFDFYLPSQNICIEYDGEQHFRRYRFEKNDEKLLQRQKRDNIKTMYCEKNNIYLLRIKYNNLNKIEKILNNKLKNNNNR